ncbi:hypothetical protein F896_00991 [Acinetobacter genomosp. 15BJ]|uniref:Uncharacterized protein n=1 Tax=Acinetobacter genomosp. 15BJ TaxID=106651 RepID=R9B4Q6_9GAMM|nr:hypothetical protein F896_00991 [Acinetobacter genomosp. 15BJ]
MTVSLFLKFRFILILSRLTQLNRISTLLQ